MPTPLGFISSATYQKEKALQDLLPWYLLHSSLIAEPWNCGSGGLGWPEVWGSGLFCWGGEGAPEVACLSQPVADNLSEIPAPPSLLVTLGEMSLESYNSEAPATQGLQKGKELGWPEDAFEDSVLGGKLESHFPPYIHGEGRGRRWNVGQWETWFAGSRLSEISVLSSRSNSPWHTASPPPPPRGARKTPDPEKRQRSLLCALDSPLRALRSMFPSVIWGQQHTEALHGVTVEIIMDRCKIIWKRAWHHLVKVVFFPPV